MILYTNIFPACVPGDLLSTSFGVFGPFGMALHLGCICFGSSFSRRFFSSGMGHSWVLLLRQASNKTVMGQQVFGLDYQEFLNIRSYRSHYLFSTSFLFWHVFFFTSSTGHFSLFIFLCSSFFFCLLWLYVGIFRLDAIDRLVCCILSVILLPG